MKKDIHRALHKLWANRLNKILDARCRAPELLTIEQCVGSAAVDVLAAKASTVLLLALGGLYLILLSLLTSTSIPYQESVELEELEAPRIEVNVRTELLDGNVTDLYDAAKDFDEIAATEGQGTCQPYPETSLAESK